MQQSLDSGAGFTLKKTINLFVIVLGLLLGTLGIAIVADMPVSPGQFIPNWPRAVVFALFGFVALTASISALRKPRLAGLFFLFAAPITASCFTWWVRRESLNEGVSFSQLILVFIGTSLPFVAISVFWLVTCRAGWPAIMTPRRSKKLFPIVL